MSKLYGKKIVRIRRRRQTFVHGFPRGRPPRRCADETPRNTASCSGQDSWSTSAAHGGGNGTGRARVAQSSTHPVTSSLTAALVLSDGTGDPYAGDRQAPASSEPTGSRRAHPSPIAVRAHQPAGRYLSLVGTRPAAVNNERPPARRLSNQRPRPYFLLFNFFINKFYI